MLKQQHQRKGVIEMPLTRKTLKAMGLTDEQVESIIDLHTEVTDGLKEKIKATEENKGDAETLKKQLEEANKKLEKAAEYEEKYNAEKKAHDEFKQKIEAAEKKQKQDSAYNEWLKKQGYSDEGRKKIIKFDSRRPEFNENGEIVDKENAHAKAIESEWGGFKETTETKGANTSNPPSNVGGNSSASRIRELANNYHNKIWGGNSNNSNDQKNTNNT